MTDSHFPAFGQNSFPASHGMFSNATRYLCAAAYLDVSFMRRVLEEVVFPAHRGIPPSYGIDVGPVAKHCLRAHRRILARDAVITPLFAAAIALGPPVLAAPLAYLYLVIVALRLVGGLLARDIVRTIGPFLILVATWLLFQLGQSLSSPSVGLDPTGTFVVVSEPAVAPGWVALAVATVGVIGLLAWHRASVHNTVVNTLQRERFSSATAPEPPSWARERMDYLAQVLESNVTVYSESVTTKPFVGSGAVSRAWSFAIPLRPMTGPFVPNPLGSLRDGSGGGATHGAGDEVFSAPVLYQRLRRAIAGLATADLPADERLQGLSIRDRLYVSGMLPETSPYLDRRTHLPVTRVDYDQILRVATRERGPERHYQVTRISTWEGEVEISVFIYTAVQGSMLFLEFVATVLPSMKPEYHEIDAYKRLGPGVVARCVGSSVIDLVRVAPMAPVHLVEDALHALTRGSRARREEQSIAARPSFDYGARMSVREIAARQTPVYFQGLDANQRIALVERRVIASVVDTLEEFGLDPQEFGTRVTNLFNSTVISNSTVQNSAVASGTNPLARMANLASNLSQAVRDPSGSRP